MIQTVELYKPEGKSLGFKVVGLNHPSSSSDSLFGNNGTTNNNSGSNSNGQQQQQIVKYHHEPPMMVKYRKPINHQNQYKKYHQIRLDPHIINNYMLLARKLAIYYGTKYQYSVDILYVC
mgnify:CR=1 FL=1